MSARLFAPRTPPRSKKQVGTYANCAGVMRQLFRNMPEKVKTEILWNLTAFPCAPADYVRRQLRRAGKTIQSRRRGWGSRLSRYWGRKEAEMDAIMKRRRDEDEEVASGR